MNKLPNRLQKIAELVSEKNICDVGCDHGKLAFYLLSEGKVDSAIVSDISKPSLEKAIKLLSGHNFKFDHICCDGLLGYEGRVVDQCIISGMGGDEIIKIIKNSPISINSFILSPQHNNVTVKKFMLSIGYNIDYDVIISDKGKFYNIFKCNKSTAIADYTDLQLIIGDANYSDKSSEAESFVEFEINKINNIFNNNKISNSELEHYLNILKQYKKRK